MWVREVDLHRAGVVAAAIVMAVTQLSASAVTTLAAPRWQAIRVAAQTRSADPSPVTGVPIGTEYSVNAMHFAPDGSLWFSWIDQLSELLRDGLGRLSAGGSVTEYTAPWAGRGLPGGPGYGLVQDFAFGAGSIWAAEQHGGVYYIGQWSMSGRLLAERRLPGGVGGIAFGADGAVWFAGSLHGYGPVSTGTYIGRMTLDGRLTTYPMQDPRALADTLVTAPDGRLWYVALNGGSAGWVTMKGAITDIPLPRQTPTCYVNADSATLGPDGALWVGYPCTNQLLRVDSAGEVTTIRAPSGTGVSFGPDGSLWFTGSENYAAFLERVTTDGESLGRYVIPNSASNGGHLIAGAGCTMWFDEAGYLDYVDVSVAPTGATAPAPSCSSGSGPPGAGASPTSSSPGPSSSATGSTTRVAPIAGAAGSTVSNRAWVRPSSAVASVLYATATAIGAASWFVAVASAQS